MFLLSHLLCVIQSPIHFILHLNGLSLLLLSFFIFFLYCISFSFLLCFCLQVTLFLLFLWLFPPCSVPFPLYHSSFIPFSLQSFCINSCFFGCQYHNFNTVQSLRTVIHVLSLFLLCHLIKTCLPLLSFSFCLIHCVSLDYKPYRHLNTFSTAYCTIYWPDASEISSVTELICCFSLSVLFCFSLSVLDMTLDISILLEWHLTFKKQFLSTNRF